MMGCRQDTGKKGAGLSPLKSLVTCISSWFPAIPSLSWSGVVWHQLNAMWFFFTWLSPGSALDKKDIFLKQPPVAELVNLSSADKIGAGNVDFHLDFLIHFDTYLGQNCS